TESPSWVSPRSLFRRAAPARDRAGGPPPVVRGEGAAAIEPVARDVVEPEALAEASRAESSRGRRRRSPQVRKKRVKLRKTLQEPERGAAYVFSMGNPGLLRTRGRRKPRAAGTHDRAKRQAGRTNRSRETSMSNHRAGPVPGGESDRLVHEWDS